MPALTRLFDVEALADWDAKHPGNAVRSLLDRWALPGRAATFEAPLRLSFRDDYAGFFIKGQPVARLSCEQGSPKILVPKVGLQNRADEPSARAALSDAARYVEYPAKALADPATTKFIGGWIETAVAYATAEQRFVDDLIAANAGIIEFDVALPATVLPGSGRDAPSMSLVVAEVVDGKPPAVAFWWAKCSISKELRKSANDRERTDGSSYRPIIDQVRGFRRWMTEHGRSIEVQTACRATAAKLLELYRLFGRDEGRVPSCLLVWDQLLQADTLAAVAQPGVAIGNYCPERHRALQPKRFEQFAERFAQSGGRAMLERHGIRVHEVGPGREGPALPRLSPGGMPI